MDMRHVVSTFAAILLMLVSDTVLLHAQDTSVSELESTFLKNVRQVTSSFVKAGEGYFSPDGKRIVYQAITKDYPFYQIYTQSLEDGRPRLVSTGRGRTTCSFFTSDVKNILFASSHLDPEMTTTEEAEIKQQEEDRKNGVRRRYSWPFDPHTEMFVATPKGKIVKRLTNTEGYDAEGAYSSNGKVCLLYTSPSPRDRTRSRMPSSA